MLWFLKLHSVSDDNVDDDKCDDDDAFLEEDHLHGRILDDLRESCRQRFFCKEEFKRTPFYIISHLYSDQHVNSAFIIKNAIMIIIMIIVIISVIMTLIGTFIDGKVRSGGDRVPVAIFGDALISTRFLLLPHLHQTPRSKEN